MSELLVILIVVTWYGGPGPNTSCGQAFDVGVVAAAAPLGGPLAFECGEVVTLCVDHCIEVVIWDRIPASSSDRYGGLVLDLTPAAFEALGLEYGVSEGGAYGRYSLELVHGEGAWY